MDNKVLAEMFTKKRGKLQKDKAKNELTKEVALNAQTKRKVAARKSRADDSTSKPNKPAASVRSKIAEEAAEMEPSKAKYSVSKSESGGSVHTIEGEEEAPEATILENNNGNMKTSKKKKRGADDEIAQACLSYANGTVTKLRVRKEVPAFRLVELAKDDDSKIVGKQVQVYWPDSKRWFTGRIMAFERRKKLHSILYKDGDKEELDLRKERFLLGILPSEDFKLKVESQSRKKIEVVDGTSIGADAMKKDSLHVSDADNVTGISVTQYKRGSKKVANQMSSVLKRRDPALEKGEQVVPDAGVDELPEKTKKRGADDEIAQACLSYANGTVTKLRVRKEVPAFRLVELAKDDDSKIVGKQVQVYWPDSKRWFTGRIMAFERRKKLHSILYKDGDKEELDLRKERFLLGILPSEDFKLKVESQSRKKIEVVDGTSIGADAMKKDSLHVSDADNVTGISVTQYKRGSKKVANQMSSVLKRRDPALEKGEQVVPDAGVDELPEKTKKRGADDEIAQACLSYANGTVTKLRVRKEVPAFRLVELAKDDDSKIVGKQVQVYWPDSKRWFTGRIMAFERRKKLHSILYKDGDKEELDLRKERFLLGILPSEDFKLKVESQSRKKIEVVDGTSIGADAMKKDSLHVSDADNVTGISVTQYKRGSKKVANQMSSVLKRRDPALEKGEQVVPDAGVDELPEKTKKGPSRPLKMHGRSKGKATFSAVKRRKLELANRKASQKKEQQDAQVEVHAQHGANINSVQGGINVNEASEDDLLKGSKKTEAPTVTARKVEEQMKRRETDGIMLDSASFRKNDNAMDSTRSREVSSDLQTAALECPAGTLGVEHGKVNVERGECKRGRETLTFVRRKRC